MKSIASPLSATTTTVYHIQFNETLKRIEEEEDDLMVLTTDHPFMGAKVDDEISGGVVLAVLIDKDECECSEDARAWAVIFSDPYVGGPEVIK